MLENRKFACADFTFPLLPHDNVLDLIAALDLKGVDIGLFEERSHLQPSLEFRNPRRSGAALKDRLHSRGLVASDIYVHNAADLDSTAVNHPDKSVRRHSREVFLRTLDYTLACAGEHITLLPGIHFPDEPRSESIRRCSDELAWRAEQARLVNVTFAVEPHVGSIIPTVAGSKALVEMTPGLTLTLDYCHFVHAGELEAKIEPLMQHCSHFHVRGASRGRLQAAFKDNTIDYARILQVMAATGYTGYLALEYVWQDWERCNEVDNLSETILFRNYLDSIYEANFLQHNSRLAVARAS